MVDDQYIQSVNAHYAPSSLGAKILDGLRAAGIDPDHLRAADLAPVDQFHTGGKATTRELATLAGISAAEQVLDIGGGIGGPARLLAQEYGCHVTVLDLTEEYCRIGAMLTERVGMSDQVQFQHGTALDLPFEDGRFDVVWTQHSSMNVADKARLYTEIARVLRSRGRGRLALHEIMAGEVQPVHFPAPWSRLPETSFLQPPGEVRRLISESGLRELAWVDTTAASLDWFTQRVMAATTPPPLGLHLLLGDITAAAMQNTVRNLREGRIAVIQAVFERR
jgi:ubiquinone/menaquinone biosynthesis C-methylase UbiE